MAKRISTKDKQLIAEMAAERAVEEIKAGRKPSMQSCLKCGLHIARPDILTEGGFDLTQEQYDELSRRTTEQVRYSLIRAGYNVK